MDLSAPYVRFPDVYENMQKETNNSVTVNFTVSADFY